MSKEEDEADLKLLSMANDKGKFAIAIGYPFDRTENDAFERGLADDWFRLIDVSPIALAPDVVCRIFRLTIQGKVRMNHARRALGLPPLPWPDVKHS